MRFSTKLKSSRHCHPSPDGNLVATVFSSIISLRSTKTLEVVKSLDIPQEASTSGPLIGLQWSPSSRFVMIAFADQVHVFSTRPDERVHAAIRHPVPPAARPTVFGIVAASDENEVYICSSLGIKFAVYNMQTCKTVEINNPKFYSPAAARRSFSFRSSTRHLAFLSRAGGKDIISLHHPATREVEKSWTPDTVDAQGLMWSPDGKWLVVWDSPAHGHRLLFFTADGQIFKNWSCGRAEPSEAHGDDALAAGVRVVNFSTDGKLLAIGDHSRCISLFDMTTVSEMLRLQHPATLAPRDTLQIWQEQVNPDAASSCGHAFVMAAQSVTPPPRSGPERSDSGLGCFSASFDSSSTLLASVLWDAPGTVWLWDVKVAALRAAIIFHGDLLAVEWHPTIGETLMVRCEGSRYEGVSFTWDPLSGGPQVIDFSQPTSAVEAPSKCRYAWIALNGDASPQMFFSNGQEYTLAALGDPSQEPTPWQPAPADGRPAGIGLREESPLELIPAGGDASMDDDESDMEDTFHYKRETDP